MTSHKIDDEFFLSSLVFENLEWLFGHEGKIQICREIRNVWMGNQNRSFIGSYDEGIRYRSGSLDENCAFDTSNVITDRSEDKNGEQSKCNFLMESTSTPPGFCKLRVLPGYYFDADLYDVESEKKVYLSSKKFLEECRELSRDGTKVVDFRLDTHGVNIIYSMWIPWPSIAGQWIRRNPHRAWPSEDLVNYIVEKGCCLIPKGSSVSQTSEWRFCFGVAELSLVSSFSQYQFVLYQFFRIVVRDVIAKSEDKPILRDVLSSYVVKHVFFWIVEENLPNVSATRMFNRFFLICMDRLQNFIDNKCVPNYFIPEENLLGILMDDNIQSLLKDKVRSVRDVGIRALLQCDSFETLKGLIEKSPDSAELRSPTTYTIEVQNDLGFIQDSCKYVYDFKTPEAIEDDEDDIRRRLLDNDLTPVQESYLKTALANIYKSAGIYIYKESINASMSNKLRYAPLTICKAFLRFKPRRDIGEKPLMLATYFYNTGNYKNALDAIAELLSKFKPYTVYKSDHYGILANDDRDEAYKYHVSGRGWTYYKKARETALLDIWVSRERPLVASELLLETELLSSEPFGWLSVPPMPYTFFLKFLCLKRIGLYDNQDSLCVLSELQAVLYDEDMRGDIIVSYSMTGICFEILHQFSDAVDHYVKAYRLAKKQKRDDKVKDIRFITWRVGLLLYKKLSNE